MDREIATHTLRKRYIRKALGVLLPAMGIAIVFIFLRKRLTQGVDRDDLLTAVAEIGVVEHTIAATGEVVPEFEQVITSPIQANIEAVLVQVGTKLEPDKPVLLLDRSFAQLALEKLEQEWELTQNGIEKLRLELEQKAFDLLMTDSTQALTISQLEAELEDAIRLKAIGGTTREAIDQLQLKLQIAQLEKRKLEHNLGIEEQQTRVSLRELTLRSQIQLNAVTVMREKLKRARVVAQRAGVLTWVNENLGTMVQEGDELARIADLNSYKVKATCANIHADAIHIGLPVSVLLNNQTQLKGEISHIRPTIENNILSFDIQLYESQHVALRPNMEVEVFVITTIKPRVVRVANGPAFTGNTLYVFVVQGDQAVRKAVEIGLRNFDYVELLSSVQVGDTVIISNMERYKDLSTLQIRYSHE